MEITIDVLKEGDIPVYDKDRGKPAVIVTEKDNLLEVFGDDGPKARVFVPLQKITPERMVAVSQAIAYAMGKGYWNGLMAVRGNEIGFVSVG
jgi:hypothetical protein